MCLIFLHYEAEESSRSEISDFIPIRNQKSIDATFSSAAERLNGKEFAFIHLSRIATFDNGNRFSAVDAVRAQVVAIQIPHRFHRICLSTKLHLHKSGKKSVLKEKKRQEHAQP